MSEVKRFTRTCDCVVPVVHGEYVLFSDYDALAQQLAASQAQCKRLLNGVEEDLAEVDRIQAEYDKQWRKSRERRIQLAARDKRLAEAEELLCANRLGKHLRNLFKDAEQAEFEKWLARKCPPGDCTAVNDLWLNSSEYDDLSLEWQELFDAAAFLSPAEDKANG